MTLFTSTVLESVNCVNLTQPRVLGESVFTVLESVNCQLDPTWNPKGECLHEVLSSQVVLGTSLGDYFDYELMYVD